MPVFFNLFCDDTHFFTQIICCTHSIFFKENLTFVYVNVNKTTIEVIDL